MEILPVPQVVTDNVGQVMRQEDTDLQLAVVVVEEDREDGETNQVEVGVRSGENVGIENVIGGPSLGIEVLNDVAGRIDPGIAPIGLGQNEVGLMNSDPPFLGVLVEDGIERFSSLSEPEEVLSSFRSKNSKSTIRNRKIKQASMANQLGVPKCIKLAEAMKERGNKGKRRRVKGARELKNRIGEGALEIVSAVMARAENVRDTGLEVNRRRQEGGSLTRTGSTPGYGLNLISGSELSRVPKTLSQDRGEDKEKLVEAAKLLCIQNEVGFNFVEAPNETIKYLIEQERGDRAKKMEWEQREGDQ
jgi:hypothetical protein